MTTEWRQGDSKTQIIAKMVRSFGGDVFPGDTEYILLRRYLRLVKNQLDNENDPQTMDSFLDLLRKTVRRRGASPAKGDGEWHLLYKWLRSMAVIPSAADVLGLWKQVLQNEDESFIFLNDESGIFIITEGGEPIIL